MTIDLGDGLLDDVIWAVLQFSKYQRVGEGGGEALEVEYGAVDSEGGSSLVLVVEDSFWKETFEAADVFVCDVVVEGVVVGLNRAMPKLIDMGLL